MGKRARTHATPRPSTARASRVGVAELRGNLARYLKQADAGTPIVIQVHGASKYVLLRFDEAAPPPIFGCLRERTAHAKGAVVNATEQWPAGALP
jgi:prevent-host-death family protein